MTDSSCELIVRYVEMIMGKSTEEQSSQNGMMLRCTGNSVCATVQTHRQSVEVEVLMNVANVKDNLLVHKRDSHSCAELGNMRAVGFNHAEQSWLCSDLAMEPRFQIVQSKESGGRGRGQDRDQQ